MVLPDAGLGHSFDVVDSQEYRRRGGAGAGAGLLSLKKESLRAEGMVSKTRTFFKRISLVFCHQTVDALLATKDAVGPGLHI
jgi:hypothetical protein